jgi:hypothetical protein
MDHPSENHNNGIGHETKEVSVPFVFGSLFALIIGTFLVSLLVIGIFQFFKATYHPDRAAKQSVQQIPPEPRIAEHPAEELQSIRSREDHILSTYALIDKDRGIVRVPIDKAIDMLAAKGLPTRNYLEDTTAGKKPAAAPAANPPAAPQGSSNAK